jgi:hypothetical protein
VAESAASAKMNAEAPKDKDGNPLPPPTPLPDGKNGKPNSWVPGDSSGTSDRQKWKPQYPVPSPKGGQPGASWDPDGHWDIDDGIGGPRQRVDPVGNPVEDPHGSGSQRQEIVPSPSPTTIAAVAQNFLMALMAIMVGSTLTGN